MLSLWKPFGQVQGPCLFLYFSKRIRYYLGSTWGSTDQAPGLPGSHLGVILGHISVFTADLADSSHYTVPQFPHSLKFQNLYVLKLSFSDHGFFEIAGQLSGITLQKVSRLGGTHQLLPEVMIGMDPERWGLDKNAWICCSYVMVGETGLSRRIKVSWEESCPVPSCCGIPHYLGTPFVLVFFPLQALNNWRALGLWILARLLAFQLYLLCSSFLPSGGWWLRALARGGRASYPISLFLKRMVWNRHLSYVPRFWIYFRGTFFSFMCLALSINSYTFTITVYQMKAKNLFWNTDVQGHPYSNNSHPLS